MKTRPQLGYHEHRPFRCPHCQVLLPPASTICTDCGSRLHERASRAEVARLNSDLERLERQALQREEPMPTPLWVFLRVLFGPLAWLVAVVAEAGAERRAAGRRVHRKGGP